MAGLQAQATPSPYVALWSRSDRFAIGDLVAAIEDRSIVKATLMRSTLHLVTAADYPAFGVPSAVAGAANWEPTIRRAGVDAAALHAGLLAFAAIPRTVAELEAYLDAEVPDDVIADSAPGGVTHVAYRAISARGGLVHVPPSGVWGASGKTRLVDARTWLGLDPASVPRFDAALSLVVRRYLAAFGPASMADIARWAGQRALGPLRRVIAGLGDAVRELEGPDGRRLIDLLDLPLSSGDETAPARFLARWDSVILGYERRDRILPDAVAPAVVRKANGDVLPTFTVDGWIAGTWSTAADRTVATIELCPLRTIAGADRRAVADEAERLIRFVGPGAADHRVVWVEP
ncbi:MAG TPA: winged helix DNA-binding domain-containing protein [Candidatus Saccharimonadia bacterium]|nr:winged helix DNA-binding domain-containing protein [Candidatus Saccharimonadia bacterium]